MVPAVLTVPVGTRYYGYCAIGLGDGEFEGPLSSTDMMVDWERKLDFPISVGCSLIEAAGAAGA